MSNDGPFDDIMDLLKENGVPMPPIPASSYTDERTCANCSLNVECWGVPIITSPRRFVLREEWDPERLQQHMKGVLGQICGRFDRNPLPPRPRYLNPFPPLRPPIARQEESQWNEEENK